MMPVESNGNITSVTKLLSGVELHEARIKLAVFAFTLQVVRNRC